MYILNIYVYIIYTYTILFFNKFFGLKDTFLSFLIFLFYVFPKNLENKIKIFAYF